MQPVGEVYLLADDRVVHPLIAAEVADRGEAGCNAHAHFEALPDTFRQPRVVQLGDGVLHFQRHPHAGYGIFRDAFGLRVAKENQHSVSDELVQSAAVLQHHAGHAIEISIQDEGQIFRLHAFGLIGESGDIGKEHGEFLAAAADPRVLPALENRLIDLPRQIPGELQREILQSSVRLLQSELRANARQNDGRTHRFDDVVHRPEAKALRLILDL